MFEREPLAGDSPLTEMNNVLLAPHSPSRSDFAFRFLSRRAGESVVDVSSDHSSRFVVNAEIRKRLMLKPTLHAD